MPIKVKGRPRFRTRRFPSPQANDPTETLCFAHRQRCLKVRPTTQLQKSSLYVESTEAKGIESEEVVTMLQGEFPLWLVQEPPIREHLSTQTSILQADTEEECLPFLLGEGDEGAGFVELPRLRRDKHVQFLQRFLGKLPTGFTALDASRPWMLYWCLNGLALLGKDVTTYREE